MKPTNRFYGCSPANEAPEDLVMVRCTHCQKSAYSSDWIAHRGDCPKCARPYAGAKNED